MAAPSTYEILGTTNTREVRGSKLVRVREYQVMSLPSETYFEFRRAAGEPCFSNPATCARNIAGRIEAVLANPLVVDVNWSQDTSPGGRLLDIMTVYYATTDGRVEGAVEIRLALFNPTSVQAAIDAELGNVSQAVAQAPLGGANVDAQ